MINIEQDRKEIYIKNIKYSFKIILLILMFVLFFLFFSVYYVFSNSKNFKLTDEMVFPQSSYRTGVIFGAGVDKEKIPNDILRDRLESGAQLYKDGMISNIIVSGNNSDENNNETEVMKRVLIEEYDIPEFKIIEDQYGYRTYDTCIRLKKVYHIEEAILVTQEYHLYRAMFLCHELGVENLGESASLNEYENENRYKLREVLAVQKAIIDIYFFTPDYTLESSF